MDRQFLFRALAFAVIARFLLLWLALLAGTDVAHGLPPEEFLPEAAVRWDSLSYLHIAEFGYTGEGHDRLLVIFLPLYPLGVWLFHFVFQDFLLSALALSFAASVAAGYYLQKLCRLEFGDKAALACLPLFIFFPTAYSLAVPYSEALALALAVSSFYYARVAKWPLASALGALACLTNMRFVLLFPALVIEAVRGAGLKRWREYAWLAIVPLGTLAYFALNFHLFGDPLMFSKFYDTQWQHRFISPLESLSTALTEYLKAPFDFTLANDSMLRVYCTAVVLGALAYANTRLRLSYHFFAGATLVALLSLTWQIGLPRYLLSIFPLFLVFGRFSARNPVWGRILLLAFLALFSYFSYLHLKGWWAYG
ncbi:MAG: hypothetical protein V1787_02805 [Candidatus Micrarchaeota archaeon]